MIEVSENAILAAWLRYQKTRNLPPRMPKALAISEPLSNGRIRVLLKIDDGPGGIIAVYEYSPNGRLIRVRP